MPVEKRDTKQTIRGVVLGLAAVGAAVGFLVLVLWFTNRGGLEIALGDDVFDAGRADIIAREIAEDGPIKYASLAGTNQHIILQHLGEDDQVGWYAFDLLAPGRPVDCQLDWEPVTQRFLDSCDPTIEFPATGYGQPGYEVSIDDDNHVIVKLRD